MSHTKLTVHAERRLVIFTKCHGGQQQPCLVLRLKLRELILLDSPRHVNSSRIFKEKAALTVKVGSKVICVGLQ